MIEAPVCFNSLRRRAEALFFMSKKRKDIWINKKKGESDLTTEIVFLRQKKKENLFQHSQRDSLGHTNSPTPIKTKQVPSHEDPC